MAEDSRVIQAVIKAKNDASAALSSFQACLVGVAAVAATVTGAIYAVEKGHSSAI